MMNLIYRPPQTINHPHGVLFENKDGSLGLIRVAKNASTEIANRLECNKVTRFKGFNGISVLFLRDPVERFISSIPETLHRVVPIELSDRRKNPEEVLVVREIFDELVSIARLDCHRFLDLYIDLVEYTFFDTHHEPQISFILDRRGVPFHDPYVFTLNALEDGMEQIFNLSGVLGKPESRLNSAFSKPLSSNNMLVDLYRRLSRSGVYKPSPLGKPLVERYASAHSDGLYGGSAWTQKELHIYFMRMAQELRGENIKEYIRERIQGIYKYDCYLYDKASLVEAWPQRLSSIIK